MVSEGVFRSFLCFWLRVPQKHSHVRFSIDIARPEVLQAAVDVVRERMLNGSQILRKTLAEVSMVQWTEPYDSAENCLVHMTLFREQIWTA